MVGIVLSVDVDADKAAMPLQILDFPFRGEPPARRSRRKGELDGLLPSFIRLPPQVQNAADVPLAAEKVTE
jgi:hypothetical protein